MSKKSSKKGKTTKGGVSSDDSGDGDVVSFSDFLLLYFTLLYDSEVYHIAVVDRMLSNIQSDDCRKMNNQRVARRKGKGHDDVRLILA